MRNSLVMYNFDDNADNLFKVGTINNCFEELKVSCRLIMKRSDTKGYDLALDLPKNFFDVDMSERNEKIINKIRRILNSMDNDLGLWSRDYPRQGIHFRLTDRSDE